MTAGQGLRCSLLGDVLPPSRAPLRRTAVALAEAGQGVPALACAIVIVCMTALSASAGERYAVVVTGASGGPQYAKQYDSWRTSFVNTLRDSWNYPDDHVYVLAEKESEGVALSTRENVRVRRKPSPRIMARMLSRTCSLGSPR